MTMLAGRFMLCPVGQLPSPGQCSCCGASDRPCIHWGLDEDFIGVVLLCENCVREAFDVLEPVAVKDIEPAVELVKSLVAELDRTRDALVRAASGIAIDLVAFRARALVLEDDLPIANGARKG